MFSFGSLLCAEGMRTEVQQRARGTDMTTLRQIKSIAVRSQDTLLQDAIGAAALMVILVVGLYLPSFV
jgi:hypothetical protein|tara:strand:+ start:18184 stop:18387 length:204 start_codon:yes stop_codon:yes gene_type:complete